MLPYVDPTGSRQALTAETQLQTQASPYGGFEVLNGLGAGFCAEYFDFLLSISFCQRSVHIN
jgi:hypothetical protein